MCTTALAQEQTPTLTVNVNVVSLLASVHDRHGHPINNLTPDDFVLKEDGVPQHIRYFSKETDLPLTIGLLVDTSRSQTGVLEQERTASATFFDQILRQDKDQAFVSKFDDNVQILQPLTSSRTLLASSLNRLSIPEDYATLLYSAVQESSAKFMLNRPGRKALILLTDGVAYKDPVSIGSAIESAQRADTILYSIRFSDPIQAYRPVIAAILGTMKERGKVELHRMAEETGGASYGVTKDHNIASIYSEIEETLRNQYSIGYTPPRAATDGKYHKIELTTKDPHLIVDARKGYYAK